MVLPLLLLTLAFLPGSHGLHWSPEPHDGVTEYSCVGRNIILGWDTALEANETLESLRWFFNGRSEQMMAILADKNFLAMPSFAHRLNYQPNGRLVVLNATLLDEGNYTLEVTGHNVRGIFFTQRRTIHVQIGSDLMTTDKQLHIYKRPTPMYNNVTKQWHITLHCGNFVYAESLPFDMQWKLPSTRTLQSSYYEKGQFYIQLPNPVQTGTYTCQVPARLTAAACLMEQENASIHLDNVQSRLEILEAQQAALLAKYEALELVNAGLRHQLGSRTGRQAEHDVAGRGLNATSNASVNVTEPLNTDWSLASRVARLGADQRELEGRVERGLMGLAIDVHHQLYDQDSKVQARLADVNTLLHKDPVSFQASVTALDKERGFALLDNTSDVIANSGGAYDPATARFTATQNGSYVFLATVSPVGGGPVSHVQLVAGRGVGGVGAALTPCPAHLCGASCHLVTRLAVGQQVWVRGSGTGATQRITFSGFLIAP